MYFENINAGLRDQNLDHRGRISCRRITDNKTSRRINKYYPIPQRPNIDLVIR
jgi:hypothetical protein